MSIDLILWYFAHLSFFTIREKLGPKIVMIQKLVRY